MLALIVVIEGLVLGFMLYLICAIGIRKGAVGMVHMYSAEVQKRVIENGLTTDEKKDINQDEARRFHNENRRIRRSPRRTR